MSKLPDNHIAVSALTGTKVRCRLLTKTRDCIPHKNEKNGDAAELLNGEMVRMVKEAANRKEGIERKKEKKKKKNNNILSFY